jgi:hypothetical protein
VLVVGIALRVADLGRLPGINGDEAWYGVNVEAFLAGERPFLSTGVGNLLNPWHSVPLLFLSYVAEPSLALLRVPSVIWGILTVLLAYPLLIRPLGARAAGWATMLLTLSPALVAYARFGWDPSGTPFFTLLAVSFAIRDRPWLAFPCWAIAMTVHPTNLFLLPIVASAWAPHALDQYARTTSRGKGQIRTAAIALIVIGVPIGMWMLARIAGNPDTVLPSVQIVIERVTSPAAWIALVTGVLDLFSGVTTAAFISGPVDPAIRVLLVGVAALAFVIPIACGWRQFRTAGRSIAPWLAMGIATSLVLFHVVAGSGMLEPAHERYAMFVLVPLVMLCALGLDAFAEARGRAGAAALAALGTVLLATTLGLYFHPLVTQGGASELTFRTGPVEPKAAAYAFIAGDSAGARVVRVTAQDWWLYWTMRYLASRDPRVHVELMTGAAAPGGLRPPGVEPPQYSQPDKDYMVVWDGVAGPSDAASVFTAADPIGRPILHVLIRTPR